jgi:hypothetical protein
MRHDLNSTAGKQRPVPMPEPHTARVRLVRELTRLQPTTMQQIIDDHYTPEAYEASIAEIPATSGWTDL